MKKKLLKNSQSVLVIALIYWLCCCSEITHKAPQPIKDVSKQIHYTEPETLFVKANDTLTINVEGYRELFIEDLIRGSYLHLYIRNYMTAGNLKYPIEHDGKIMITRVYY